MVFVVGIAKKRPAPEPDDEVRVVEGFRATLLNTPRVLLLQRAQSLPVVPDTAVVTRTSNMPQNESVFRPPYIHIHIHIQKHIQIHIHVHIHIYIY